MLKCGKKLGIIYSCSFVIFLDHKRKVNINKRVCSFLWWQRNELKKATADKILTLKKIIISYIFVHFFSDKETNQRNHPLTHFLL